LQDKQSVAANAWTGNHNDEGHAFIRGGNSGRYNAAFRMAEHTDTPSVDLSLSLEPSYRRFGVRSKISRCCCVVVT